MIEEREMKVASSDPAGDAKKREFKEVEGDDIVEDDDDDW